MAKVLTQPTLDDGVGAFDVSSPLLSLKSIRSLSYNKLPPQLTRLYVLKLDGSSFDVHVARNAKVGDIKSAIEDLFNSSSSNDGQDHKIPWSEIWGYFCLCYKGKKLTNDKADIQSLGMKDNDQLRFVRHMVMLKYTRGRRPQQQHSSGHFLMCLSRPHTHEVNDEISVPKFRVSHLFRRKMNDSSGFIFNCYGIKKNTTN